MTQDVIQRGITIKDVPFLDATHMARDTAKRIIKALPTLRAQGIRTITYAQLSSI